MFIHNCTIYRQNKDEWQRTVLRGVLWVDVEGINILKSGLKDTNSVEIYIPKTLGFEIQKKDIVIKGICDYEIKSKPSELYDKGKVRTITTVDDYDFGKGMAIYKAGGR